MATYDGETRRAIEELAGEVDDAEATEVWEAALTAAWSGPPVWVHGDLSVGNLLVKEGRTADHKPSKHRRFDPAVDIRYVNTTTLQRRCRQDGKTSVWQDG